MPLGDGSWDLQLVVTDLQVERVLRVVGGEHVGGVMIKLVDMLDIAMDWSDHAVWWPARNLWLTNTRWTLDQVRMMIIVHVTSHTHTPCTFKTFQYCVTADEVLHFTPMHKTLRIQLPDLRYTDCRVDFSIKTFNAVITLCKELGIRHPEVSIIINKVCKYIISGPGPHYLY